MEEKTVHFTMEMDVNEAYLRDTWAAYPKIRRATRLLALLPIAGFLVGGWMWVVQGELTLGFLVVALLFLAFDLALPRLLADVPVTTQWLAGLGNGGLCLNCPECHFPNCGFGKGV